MVENFDDVLIVAQWRPTGRSSPGEGGAWGWCLAGDWAGARMRQGRWAKAKADCAARMPTRHLSALEDALSEALVHAGLAAAQAGLPIVSVVIGASGHAGSRVAMVVAGYRQGSDCAGLPERAVASFFEGLAHGCRSWSVGEPQPRNSDALRSELFSIGLSRFEREQVSASAWDPAVDADEKQGTKRI